MLRTALDDIPAPPSAKLPAGSRAPAGMRFVPIATLKDEALPTVMRKVIAHGLD